MNALIRVTLSITPGNQISLCTMTLAWQHEADATAQRRSAKIAQNIAGSFTTGNLKLSGEDNAVSTSCTSLLGGSWTKHEKAICGACIAADI